MTAPAATKARELEINHDHSVPVSPSDHALLLAATLNTQLQGRTAKIRLSFIRRSVAGPPPPLARILRGGRGGDVRLKLLLSLLWVAGGGRDDRHKTRAYPARAWAGLLDLPDPEANGQRRIRDAVQWLRDQGFLRTEREPGRPATLQLLQEDGSGGIYEDPAANAGNKKKSNESMQRSDLYVQLPPSFWTDGWIMLLSGRAIAMLLVLADLTFGASEGPPKWVSPRLARDRYGISEDTWSKGVAELKKYNLVIVRKAAVGEDYFEFRRTRNTYRMPRDENSVIALPRP